MSQVTFRFFFVALMCFIINCENVDITSNSTQNQFRSNSITTQNKQCKSESGNKSVTNECNVLFYLYVKENLATRYRLYINDTENLKNSNFFENRITKLIIHGYLAHGDKPYIKTFIDNYMEVGDYNVIVVDWSEGAKKSYGVARNATKEVGHFLAQLLSFLERERGLDLRDVHILGHSLGAHVAGYTGSYLNGKIGRITGLDPARPAFEVPILNDVDDRLDETDGVFVDVIHTNAGKAGFVLAIGHVDFYPNGGERQTGCRNALCNHSRASMIMAESILNPKGFLALKCSDYSSFRDSSCGLNAETAFVGEFVDPAARGDFFLDTNPKSPFGKGVL